MGEVFQPSDNFCSLLWTCSNRSVSVLYWWQFTSLDLLATLLLRLNTAGFLGYKSTLPAHSPFFIPSPSLLDGSQPLHPSVSTAQTQMQDLELGPVEPLEVLFSLSTNLSWSLWMASLPSRVSNQFLPRSHNWGKDCLRCLWRDAPRPL